MAKYIKRKYPDVRKVFAVGSKAIRQALEAESIEVVGADVDVIPPDQNFGNKEFEIYELDPEIGAVVYGIDYGFNNAKLCIASLYLNEMKVPLIVSNDDANALIYGHFMPGAGAALQSILTATDLRKGSHPRSTSIEEPGTFDLLGKPNPFTIDLIR